MNLALLVYGFAAITVAVLVPIRGTVAIDDGDPEPLWPGTVIVLRALAGLLWPIVAPAHLVAWYRKRRCGGAS